MTRTEYERLPGITATAIKAGRLSMKHMHRAMLRERDSADDTPALRWGRLAHLAILEPLRLPDAVAVFSGDKRGRAWTDAKAAAEQAGKTIVTEAELADLRGMSDSAREDRHVRSVVAQIEHTEYILGWDEPDTYGPAKARLDGWGKNCVAEYKTCRSINKRSFFASAYNLGYELQLGWYWHGAGEPEHVYVVAQESEAPHSCAVYVVPPVILVSAYERAAAIASQYRACVYAQEWPGPFDEIMRYELPAWASGGEWVVGGDEAEPV